MFSVWEQVHWYRLNEAEWSCFDSLGSWSAQADQQKAILEKEEKYLVGNAPINVKPERGGGSGLGNPREFDCDAYPQGGDFDLTSCI